MMRLYLATLVALAFATEGASTNGQHRLASRQAPNPFMSDAVGSGVGKWIASGPRYKPIRPAKTIDMPAESFKLTPGAKRRQVLYGPFTLQAANGTHKSSGDHANLKLDAQSDVVEEALGSLCDDCELLSLNAKIVDKDLKHLTIEEKIYVHHVLSATISRQMPMPVLAPAKPKPCPPRDPKAGGKMGGMSHSGHGRSPLARQQDGSNDDGRRLNSDTKPSSRIMPRDVPAPALAAAAVTALGLSGILAAGIYSMLPVMPRGVNFLLAKGNEVEGTAYAVPNDTSIRSGFWVGKSDHIIISSELVNYDSEPRDVYLMLDMDYVKMPSRPKDYMDVGIAAIMMDCSASFDLKVPKDRPAVFESGEWIARADGYIMNFKPHMHDGGVALRFTRNNKPVCQVDAIYTPSGGTGPSGQKWQSISGYTPCDPIAVKKGDVIKLIADYDLTRYSLRPSELGGENEAMALGIHHFAVNTTKTQ